MELTDDEIRVLGCLIEKRATTPEQYPLSTNSLVNACNQKTNREPVTQLTERDVIGAMMELRANKLCRSISSGRTDKHKHVLDEALGLGERQLAVLAIMLLRGPQTPGELRTRTERYVDFDSVEEVEEVLSEMAGAERPLAIDLGRGPGQSQNRFMHLLGGPIDAEAVLLTSADPAPARSSRNDRVAELETLVQQLDLRITRLETELGITEPDHVEVTGDQPHAEPHV
ncbi:MAG: YceH family protein [Acidimicrobiales bacterium]